MMNDLSCGMRMWAEFSFVSSQCTHLTEERTDRQTERPWQYRACITCSHTVKRVRQKQQKNKQKTAANCNFVHIRFRHIH